MRSAVQNREQNRKAARQGGSWVWRSLQRHHRMECAPMQTATQTKSDVGRFYVPPGRSSSPISKLRHRLLAPFYSWQYSILRISVVEVGRMFLRIREYVREPSLCRGYRIPLPKREGCGPVFGGRNSYVDFCNEDMQQLLQKYRWVGYLDRQIVAQAYQRGAEWGADNLRNGSEHRESQP
jgi:hypothetical protein